VAKIEAAGGKAIFVATEEKAAQSS
jgi:hypothetical protein